MLILTALDNRARATVCASHIEHPTDKEKEREREPYRQGERKRKRALQTGRKKEKRSY